MPRSFSSSLFNLRCARCRTGSMFIEPFELSKPIDMPVRCATCNQKIEPEPGFYFGALFISYGISGWLLLFVSLMLVFYFDWSVEAAMGVVLFIAVLFYIKLLRFSRSLWMHLMIKHDPSVLADKTES